MPHNIGTQSTAAVFFREAPMRLRIAKKIVEGAWCHPKQYAARARLRRTKTWRAARRFLADAQEATINLLWYGRHPEPINVPVREMLDAGVAEIVAERQAGVLDFLGTQPCP